MKNRPLKLILRILGISLMLIAFPLMPDGPPWYYEVFELLLFDVGLILWLITMREKFKHPPLTLLLVIIACTL